MEKYTLKEIQYNIDKLTSKMDQLKLNRTQITKDINSLKKQIDFWESIDESQLKMFNVDPI
jgi:cell division protein FtsB